MELHIEAEAWPFKAYVNDEGHLAVAKHDTESGAVGAVVFHNTVHGDLEIEVQRFDEAKFGAVRVTVI